MSVKRYTVNAASIAELYDLLPGVVVSAHDYDALEADRDQISLQLDLAKADRDKWFNTARDELALRQTAEAYAARNALRVIELEAALTKAAETFEDIEKASRLLRRMPTACAALIAGANCRAVLAVPETNCDSHDAGNDFDADPEMRVKE